jgi:hypothetical protein
MVHLLVLRMGATAALVLKAHAPAYFLSFLYDASEFVSGFVPVKLFILQWEGWVVLGL